MDESQNNTHVIHTRLMVGLAASFTLIFGILTIAPMFIDIGEKMGGIVASMKDATVNIMMIIIGYVFGSSSSSRLKDMKPDDKKGF